MTREELVKQKAQEFASSGKYSPTLTECFVAGVEWEHKRLVEKACKYLQKVLGSNEKTQDLGDLMLMDFIADFRKAMEE